MYWQCAGRYCDLRFKRHVSRIDLLALRKFMLYIESAQTSDGDSKESHICQEPCQEASLHWDDHSAMVRI